MAYHMEADDILGALKKMQEAESTTERNGFAVDILRHGSVYLENHGFDAETYEALVEALEVFGLAIADTTLARFTPGDTP